MRNRDFLSTENRDLPLTEEHSHFEPEGRSTPLRKEQWKMKAGARQELMQEGLWKTSRGGERVPRGAGILGRRGSEEALSLSTVPQFCREHSGENRSGRGESGEAQWSQKGMRAAGFELVSVSI